MTGVWPFALLRDVASPSTGSSAETWQKQRTYHALGSVSSGTGAASVLIEVSNDNINFMTLATFTLTLGVAVVSDGHVSDETWAYVRGRVVSISGTGAKVSLFMGF